MTIPKTVAWTDVSLRNAVIMFESCKRLGISADFVFHLIPERAKNQVESETGKSWDDLVHAHKLMLKNTDRGKFEKDEPLDGGKPNQYLTELEEALIQVWITLDEYNRIQNVFKQKLGHMAYLRTVGHVAPETAMGGSDAWNWKLLRFALKWMIDPFLAFLSTVYGSKIFVHNKDATAFRAHKRKKNGTVVLNDGACYVAYKFVDGPQGIRAREMGDDYPSLLSYIPGIGESVLKVWPHAKNRLVRALLRLFYPVQEPVGNLHVDVVPMSLRTLIERESWNGYRIDHRMEGDEFQIRPPGLMEFQTVGHRVTLVPSEFPGKAHGRFLGGDDYVPGDAQNGNPVGILLNADIVTPCARTRKDLPIARAGQIFSEQAPETIIRATWHTHPILSPLIRRFSDWTIKKQMDSFRELLRHEMQTAVFAGQAQSTQATLALQSTALRAKFPTSELADAIFAGSFDGYTNECGVLVADIRGYTRATGVAAQRGESDLFASMIHEFHERARQEVNDHAGWTYLSQGDQVIAIFTSDWGRWGRSQAEDDHMTNAELFRGQVDVARALAAIADEYSLALRIALHHGRVSWKKSGPDKMDGTGDGINICAHLEGVGLKDYCRVHETPGSIIGMTEAFVDQAYTEDRLRGRIPSGLQSPRMMTLKEGNRVSVYVMEPEVVEASSTSTQSVVISGMWSAAELGTAEPQELPDDITGAFPAFIEGLDDASTPTGSQMIPTLQEGASVDPFLD